MPERDVDPRRLLWIGPLTIMASIAAVLVVRSVALLLVSRPARFVHVAAWWVTVTMLTRLTTCSSLED